MHSVSYSDSITDQIQVAIAGVPIHARFILLDQIILEIKAVREFADEHRAQVHNYLKATGYRLGLLVNFSLLDVPTMPSH